MPSSPTSSDTLADQSQWYTMEWGGIWIPFRWSTWSPYSRCVKTRIPSLAVAVCSSLFPKIIYAGNFPYLVIITMTKNSILLYYLRLFGTPGIRQGFRNMLFVTQALVIVWLIASVIPGILRCHPINDMWNPLVISASDVRHYCIDANAYYVSTSTFNVVLDVWILMLPISIVWTLQLSRRRKAGLSAIFLFGGLSVLCLLSLRCLFFSL